MRKNTDFFLLDLIVIELAFAVAYAIRHDWSILGTDRRYFTGAVVVAAAAAIWIILSDAYRGIRIRGYAKELISVLRLVGLICVTLMGYLFFVQRGEEFSRLVVLYFAVTGSVMLYAARLLWKRVRYIYGRSHEHVRRIFIMAPAARAGRLVHQMASGGENLSVAAVMYTDGGMLQGDEHDSGKDMNEWDGVDVVPPSDAAEYIQHEWIDEVVYAGDGINADEADPDSGIRTTDILDECAVMGITVHRLLDMKGESYTAKTVGRIGGMYAITESLRSVDGYQLAAKRLMDILGSVAGLVITVFLTLILAPAIIISDPGPVFFSQERVGRNGRIFRIYKFRSMYRDAEERKAELESVNEADGMMFKVENDPRVLGSGPDGCRHGLGYFIRRHSLDEFPQFFNVLKGDMSLVGTRPPTVDEWQRYEQRHRARLTINPGLTGLWQVAGRSDITDFDEVIALDMKYINEWTIAGDIKLICRTVVEVFTGSGAK